MWSVAKFVLKKDCPQLKSTFKQMLFMTLTLFIYIHIYIGHVLYSRYGNHQIYQRISFTVNIDYNLINTLTYNYVVWVEQVIKEKSLGIIRGKRSQRLFEPKDYKKRQINLLKSIFDSNGFISNIYAYIIYTLQVKFKHIFPLGFDTVENLYIFNNAVDLVKDNYDPNSYYVLHSCIIKTHIKDSAKDALQSMTDYCDVNVSCRFISTFFFFLF